MKQPPTFRPNGYKYYHLLWITSGVCTYTVSNDTFILSKGDGIFMRPNVPHSYKGEGLFTSWCTFTADGAIFDHLGISEYLKFKAPPFLQKETERLNAFSNGESTVLERSAALYSYIVELFSAITSENERLSDKVTRLLEQHYAEPLGLQDVSDFCGVGKFTLCHVFKEEKGLTVIEELNKIRIKKAKQMLKYDNASSGSIAKACGFESPSYFGRRFKEEVGCTPIEYRKTYRRFQQHSLRQS